MLCYNNHVFAKYENKFCSIFALKTDVGTQTDFSDNQDCSRKQVSSGKQVSSIKQNNSTNFITGVGSNLLCENLQIFFWKNLIHQQVITQ